MEELIRLIKSIFRGELLIYVKQVKAQKTSGVVYVPRKFRNKKVVVLIENEDKGTDLEGRN